MLSVSLSYEVCLNYCMTTGTDGVSEFSAVDRDNVESMIADHGMIVDDAPYEPPPGDEGLDISYEGGEYKAFEGLSRTMADLSGL